MLSVTQLHDIVDVLNYKFDSLHSCPQDKHYGWNCNFDQAINQLTDHSVVVYPPPPWPVDGTRLIYSLP